MRSLFVAIAFCLSLGGCGTSAPDGAVWWFAVRDRPDLGSNPSPAAVQGAEFIKQKTVPIEFHFADKSGLPDMKGHGEFTEDFKSYLSKQLPADHVRFEEYLRSEGFQCDRGSETVLCRYHGRGPVTRYACEAGMVVVVFVEFSCRGCENRDLQAPGPSISNLDVTDITVQAASRIDFSAHAPGVCLPF
jgi:hypothetical protein